MSSFTIVTTALLIPSVAEPTGTLATFVSITVNVRSAFTTASSMIVTTTFEVAWPGANASTLVTPV